MYQTKWPGWMLLISGLVSCGGGSVSGDAPAAAPAQFIHVIEHPVVPASQFLSGDAPVRRLAAAGTPTISANALLDWAETSYKTFFPSPVQPIALSGWTVRHYASGNYLGVRDDGEVFGLGPATNNVLLALGKLTDFTCQVSPSSCRPAGAVIGVGGIAAWDALQADEKARVKTTMRSFFLHQSVGGDLEDGAQAVGFKFEYAANGTTNLPAGLNGGLFASSNGDPIGKIAEFRNMALTNRTTLGVAIMKFGYADIVADKVEAVKTAYLEAVNSLKAQGVRVLHVTPPLVYNVPSENATKVQMRNWMLTTFAQDTIFDLEDLESTDPSTGARCERDGSWEICDAVRSTASCPSLGQGVDAPSGQGHLCFNPHAQRLANAFLYAIYRSQL